MIDFSGPTTEPEDPVLRAAVPDGLPRRRGGRRASSAGSPRARLRDGKAAAAIAIIDALEEAGLPPG